MLKELQHKLDRLRNGQPPRLLDLFAGCGGLSLGFQSAGFELIGAVENDPSAIKSHAMNFFMMDCQGSSEKHSVPRDITHEEPHRLLADLGYREQPDSLVDVIIGGPPCQAFARVGRAKLREVADHPEAFLSDPRSNLYLRYLEYVRKLKPVAILMENVIDVLNFGGHNISEEICEILDEWGYVSRYTTLNSALYGVPQMRERMFLVAYLDEVSPTTWFPPPSHHIDLPRGYHGSRQVALKTLSTDLFTKSWHYIDAPEETGSLMPAVTTEEALSDLPIIDDNSPQKKTKGTRRFHEVAFYRRKKGLTPYQDLMRTWPGYEGTNGVKDHVIRYLPRDYKIFARMKPGDQYPEAYQLAELMFQERLDQIETSEGKRPSPNSPRYVELRGNFVPPYDPSKFPNKWRKMEADEPARTLMAHLGKDGYSHIHYDSAQARTISVREAARLQSFPDGFVFEGPMNPAFRQIGNAVPPLLAKAIATTMHNQLLRASTSEKKDRLKEAVSL